jgi:hypothetical protein
MGSFTLNRCLLAAILAAAITACSGGTGSISTTSANTTVAVPGTSANTTVAVPAANSADKYVGINLSGLAYYSTEQPFLNLFKQAASNNTPQSNWVTWVQSGSGETNEEAYLANELDADGYPTTLTVSDIPGGQKFNAVGTWMNWNLGDLPPGALQLYPAGSCTGDGSYTLEFEGKGTIQFGGDVQRGSLATKTPGVTVSGLNVTSSNPWPTVNVVTFCIPAAKQGIAYNELALPDSANYIKNVSIVESKYLSSYLAGEIFHPLLKAELARYKRVRFMDWGNTNQQEWIVAFSGALSAGSTSGTMTSSRGFTNGVWTFPTGTYTFVFATGQTIAVDATYKSSMLTWSTPLNAYVSTSNPGGMAFFIPQGNWASRSKPSNAFWGANPGYVPWEVKIQLCNELGADCWLNIPFAADYTDPTYTSQLAALVNNGNGASLSGSVLTSFNGLNSTQVAYVELGNEEWNFGNFQGPQFAVMMSNTTSPTNFFTAQRGNGPDAGQEWYGTQVAGVGDTWYASYGASTFASRVKVVMANQFGSASFMKIAMNTPDWSTAAYTHHIGALAMAPYMNLMEISGRDAAAIVTAPDPLGTFFALAYTNTYKGITFSSLPAQGYVGATVSTVKKMVTGTGYNGWSDEPWGTLPLVGYEGGTQIQLAGTPFDNWPTLMLQAHRDERMGYLYYDPSHQLSANDGYLPMLSAAGMQAVNQFVDCGAAKTVGISFEFGLLEGATQTINPLSSAPYKYQAVQTYITQ